MNRDVCEHFVPTELYCEKCVFLVEIGRLRTQHLEAHQNSAAMSAALTEISALTHLGGEVAEYGDVVEAVRRLKSANLKLAGAIDMIRETLNGGTVDDLLYIINTALAEHRSKNG